MSDEPTLSVLMPNYNHGCYLPHALNAILSQSWRPFEVVVCDDGSRDNSMSVLNDIAAREPCVRILRNEVNLGVIATLNKLVAAARGEYVYLAAADDMIQPEFLEKSMGLLLANPGAALCSTYSVILDSTGRQRGILVVGDHRPSEPLCMGAGEAQKLLMRYGSWVQGNSVVWRRSALVELGSFRPELKSYTDGFFYEVALLRWGGCFAPMPLAGFRRLDDSYSAIVGANPTAIAEIRDQATRLMRTVYRNDFSPAYIRRWYGRWQFELVRSLLDSVQRSMNCSLDALSVGGSSTERRVRAAVRIGFRIFHTVVFVVAAFAYRRADMARRVLRLNFD